MRKQWAETDKAIVECCLTQEREKAEAQQATRAHDNACWAFADWLCNYQPFACVTLSDQPDHLEHLGVAAPSKQ